jgi:hypothetical protein
MDMEEADSSVTSIEFEFSFALLFDHGYGSGRFLHNVN